MSNSNITTSPPSATNGLQGTDPNTTYSSLLQVAAGATGLSGAMTTVYDGNGTASPMQLSNASVYLGNMTFNGNTIGTTSGTLNITPNVALGGNLAVFGNVTVTGILTGAIPATSITGQVLPANGGTGVNNGTNTITVGGNVTTAGAVTLAGALTTTGAYTVNQTYTANTAITMPTSGTVISTASNNGVSLGMLAQIGAHTLIGNTTGSTANPNTVATSNFIQSINVQAFGASGTYTPTPGMVFCIAKVQAAGGGSGGTNGGGNTVGIAGAGAGSYAEVLLTAAQIGTSQTVTLGAPGTAGTTAPTSGGNAAVTTLGTLISCPGGNGSAGSGTSGSNLSLQGATGGAAPTVSTGTILKSHAGANGGTSASFGSSTTVGFSGAGGNSESGIGGLSYAAQNVAGSTGTGFGQGAGGGYTTSSAEAGAVGGAAIVQIIEYIAL